MQCLYFRNTQGYYYALLSAFLFGSSIPLSKYLLDAVNPWILGGLLYSGSAIGLITLLIVRKLILKTKISFSFKPKAWIWVTLSALLGGIIGPVLLLYGLSQTDAAMASLLLSFENVFTVILAWVIFKERVDRRTTWAIFLIILGSFVLVWNNQLNFNNLRGLCLIILACLCWAFDNNIVKKVATEDPVKLALVKCSVAGITNSLLGLMAGGTFPSKFNILISISFVGIVCYAFSLLLFILALRHIGAMRTGAYYSFSFFIGAILSVLLLGERLSTQLVIAGFLMVCGVLLDFSRIPNKPSPPQVSLK